MSTTELAGPEVARLDVKDPRWARVDLGDLGGTYPRLMLAAQAGVANLHGVADAGKIGDLVPTYWAALFLVSPAFVAVLSRAGLTGWSVTSVTSLAIRQP